MNVAVGNGWLLAALAEMQMFQAEDGDGSLVAETSTAHARTASLLLLL